MVDQGSCQIEEGLAGDADCVVSAEASVYEDVEQGKMAAEMAVMSGKLRISDLGIMMRFIKYFKRIQSPVNA